MFRTLLPAVALAIALPGLALAQNVHLRGTVDAVDGDAVTMTTTGGETVEITMAADYPLMVYTAIEASELQAGDFLSIPSIPGADGGKTALSINVFPEAMRGAGEGERPWDMTDDSLMTNATIGQVAEVPEGRVLTVTYEGAEEPITVPEAAPITRFAPDPDRRLAPGDLTIVFATLEDGVATGTFAGISADGTLPPL